ncbi:MAG: chromosome segregation protein SMC [Candidatus Limnocylindrales bacterium]
MTASPRLLGLRLHGFKSFAERTVIEFGGGISAIVGPNGSGKSNLADALRWALGEQGRSLRSRKSEDVVFAGSERRAALGMADVTLILDNADGLLPVDYSVLELGRRLYRSGENDYLLNRNRIRLRDLVDLLDAAHLADNAFLFIGQGMVDQALSLRPEERRPLFEEVAGVRRHERRRRRAEEQLAEAEVNLARVLDIVGELRPRVRRLAAQAEQQTSRAASGSDLVAALLGAGHARWHLASAEAAARAARQAGAERDAATARTTLAEAEAEVAVASASLAGRTSAEAAQRAAHDAARTVLAELERREARLAAEVEAASRDRQRIVVERDAARADLVEQRRIIGAPLAIRDVEADARAAEAERELADGLRELNELRSTNLARGEALVSLRRAVAARAAELETAGRRAADLERRLGEVRAAATAASERRTAEERRLAEAMERLTTATEREDAAVAARAAARSVVEGLDEALVEARDRASAAGARAAALAARSAAERARVEEDERRPIARLARLHGGRRIDAELVVEPAFRAAVELALGEAIRGYVVPPTAIEPLAGERGVVVLERAAGDHGDAVRPDDATTGIVQATAAERARRLGGGILAEAIRTDSGGIVRRILDGVCWVPDLAALIELQPSLPPGSVAVLRNGSAIADRNAFRFGPPDGSMERRDLLVRLEADVRAASDEATAVAAAAAAAAGAVEAARRALDEARAAEGSATGRRRRAEEDERSVARTVEGIAREALWQAAQVERLSAEVERARAAVEALGAEVHSSEGRGTTAAGEDDEASALAIATWEVRIAELRERRDRLAAERDARESARREAENRRARAEAAMALDEDRIARAEHEAAALGDREHLSRAELDEVRVAIGTARQRETGLRAVIEGLQAEDASDRARLTGAEVRVVAARERLAATELRVRGDEVAGLEARLGLDAIRDGLLVELSGLGGVGLLGLAEEATVLGASPAIAASATVDEAAAATLGSILPAWAAAPPPAEAPSAARIASLRRRFHDLGAVDPSAIDEFAEVRGRLESLESQERDLRRAIDETRRLIAELSAMVAGQFRTTFSALEAAFDARFQQLFGGGTARLALTDPSDLAATGIEIVARPPGKKPGTLAILSGGERALTAVALLFAMLEVRPVPFCVLDEVDAALDEANVGRFADALRSLADRTQFIVITHNRGTIEAADALYGVTVGDDSVSRVISLRLDEATAIAARASDDRVAPAAQG